MCECRELRQKIEVGVTLFLGSNGRAGRGVLSKNSLDMKARGRIRQLVLSHVHQESKVPEEVCSDDWLLDVGDDEYPLEGAAKAEVEG